MKKVKLVVLTAMAALTLAGCNNDKTGSLPSGGKKVDVTTETGQATLKEKLRGAEKAYKELSFDSASLAASVSGVNLSANINAEAESIGKFDLNANVKDAGGKLEAKLAKHAKGESDQYDYVDASLVAETTGGSVSIKGTVPGAEQGKTANLDASLNLKGAKYAAYLSGSKIYVDASAKGNADFINGLDKFGNDLLGQLKDSVFGALLPYIIPEDIPEEILDRKDLKFTIADFYNAMLPDKQVFIDMGAPVEWPAVSQEEAQPAADEDDGLDEFVAQIAELAKQNIGFEFRTYDKSSFGFALAMNKESLINLVKAQSETEADANEAVEQINKMIKKLSVSADVFFNKQGLLESAGVSFELDLKLDKEAFGEDVGSAFTTLDGAVSGKGSAKAELKYGGVKVSFPDFTNYKELKLAA